MLIPFLRTLILYLLIILAIRFMGKRQVGEMQPTELVVTILISAVASVPMQDISIPLAHGVIPILTLIAAEVLISTLSLKSIRFRRALSGNPVTIIKNGVIDQKALKSLRMSIDDILEDLRLKDIFDINAVKYAQIETNGRISLLLNAGDSPLTANDMGITPIECEPFHVLVADGKYSKAGLASSGRSEGWVQDVITANGAKNVNDVFLLCADSRNNIVFMKKE